ncbi:MAG: bifunctional 2-keto-4-hydroxyglutarate aldolase/2-keto-3-deoxy-6-phosphogluconate aldolase [Paracholeplasma sp.]|jgi:2-dehydro-3-deoxyphosphogluconate aldolase/(4S)-4-hydroxy-2-oxoglutarate aldolase|uniref:2-dehydro-3-deoxyphosphogluconate aldolase/4-hydroxy-2-oxoglutarate aldolase n=1 Tax=Acholeplasma brassicae TaxID=61635 RepID=U4KRM5_9MOLU|nr:MULTISPECIES: bifunctional 2-keto-4-hydroxyglutarate aldolase/2-keto-3-deoxy-6-phosphogluconate aldolase [Paracholeplasma]MDY3195629.1 bifunctional 2-keto-4-hydroxyglutarate aldolase/2-keto-3-deoxy-6-phosphogluconate aldolase [Paracholeplasma sp.]CCV65873.1 2-dehydro-3-deoxyphosphogluconate aldolase/4-hydroxy-2-oxoglutarate aldolase [Paracholeplasma brassicae]
MKNDVLKRITDVGVVAVVRATTAEEAFQIAEACIKGGLPAIELTFTVPNADQVIKKLAQTIDPKDLILGAGTVLDAKTTQIAIDAGAKYIVSPGFDLESAQLCQKLGVPYMPGCLTITEMLTAQKAGAEVVKLFPGSAFGPGYVKAVKGPLPNINIMPTGGVSLDNVEQWIKNGVVAVGVGGELTAPAKTGDFEGVTANARAFVEAVKRARS